MNGPGSKNTSVSPEVVAVALEGDRLVPTGSVYAGTADLLSYSATASPSRSSTGTDWLHWVGQSQASDQFLVGKQVSYRALRWLGQHLQRVYVATCLLVVLPLLLITQHL